MTTGKTIALTRWAFVGKVMSLLLNMLSRLVITFLPRSKRLLISWLQSPSACTAILFPKTFGHFSAFCGWSHVQHVQKSYRCFCGPRTDQRTDFYPSVFTRYWEWYYIKDRRGILQTNTPEFQYKHVNSVAVSHWVKSPTISKFNFSSLKSENSNICLFGGCENLIYSA